MNKKKQPLVSVFLPTYNHERFLTECLDSIFSQDYKNLRVVCGDDFSEDSTRDIMRKYAKKHSDTFVPIYNKKNLGFVGNFNSILSSCIGKYIIFFSGDDVMLPKKILKLVNFMEANQDHALCYHDLEVFDSATNKAVCKYSDIATPPKNNVESLLKPGTFVIGPSIIIRKSAIPTGGFNPSLKVLADWLFMIESATHGKIGYINEVLARYRRHDNNISNKKSHYPEYFIGMGILRSKYPNLCRSINAYEGFIFTCFMANFIREKKMDLAFVYAKNALFRGYKPHLLLPIWLLSLARFGLIKKVVDVMIIKVFTWLDKRRKVNLTDYKIYQKNK